MTFIANIQNKIGFHMLTLHPKTTYFIHLITFFGRLLGTFYEQSSHL